MTRETKIGLLVGLAFIIVIGILLSDHLTSSTEPPPAAIAQAGQTVRSAVVTPVGTPQQPPVTIIQPPQVQPQQTVQTANDLTPKPQPVTMVQIAPPAQSQGEPVTVAQRAVQQGGATHATNEPETVAPPVTVDPAAQAPVTLAGGDAATSHSTAGHAGLAGQTAPPPPVAPRQNDPILARLNGEAQRFGEMLVPVGGAAGGNSSAAASAAGKYKAEPGDTLAKIAQKSYGTAAKAYRDAIVNANPSLQENPNLVIAGRTYVIPSMPSAAARTAATADAAAGTTPARQPPVPPAAATNPPARSTASAAPVVATATEAVYVVEQGDNLTRIAVEHLGSPAGVAAIKELNRDLLKGSDVIRPGMKLRLPAKVAASN